MLEQIKTLKSSDCLLLCLFASVKGEDKYIHLVTDSMRNKDTVSINVEKIIDDLVFDNYSIYLDVKHSLKEGISNEFWSILNDMTPNELKLFDDYKTEVKRYIDMYEGILLKSKFEQPATRSIQKQFIESKILEEIETENYEYCAELKRKINNI
jgi:hypothetical protein